MGRKADSEAVSPTRYRAEKIFRCIVLIGPNKQDPSLCDVSVVGEDIHWYGVHPDCAMGIAIDEIKKLPERKEIL